MQLSLVYNFKNKTYYLYLDEDLVGDFKDKVDAIQIMETIREHIEGGE